MKKVFASAACLMILFLAGCQPADPLPAPQPNATPVPATPALPTITPLPVEPTSSVLTAVKPLHITAFCTLIGKDLETYIPLGTPVIITWGWEAKTEMLLEDFLENNLTTITFDGKALQGTMVEGNIKNEKSGQPEAVWFSEIGTPEEGLHVITYDVSWKKMINDGTTTYGPGSKNETLHDECHVIVR